MKKLLTCRNKAHNGAQLLMVMADVYNNYLRLRLADVILKKEGSSKTASGPVPLSAVTHKDEALYVVNSTSKEGIAYEVDLSIGTCSCTEENTGKVCKHQLAASQYSAVRLPQVYKCTKAEKQHFFKVMYGNKPMPSEDFFEGLLEDTHVSTVCNGTKPEPASNEAEIDLAEQVVMQIPAAASNSIELTHKKIDDFTRMLNVELKRASGSGTVIHSPLDIFEKRMKACRNPAQVANLMRTAGCALYRSSGAHKRKIHCQPTSVARRSIGQPRGRSALLKGKVIKRKRNLTLNISKNQPNAKVH